VHKAPDHRLILQEHFRAGKGRDFPINGGNDRFFAAAPYFRKKEVLLAGTRRLSLRPNTDHRRRPACAL